MRFSIPLLIACITVLFPVSLLQAQSHLVADAHSGKVFYAHLSERKMSVSRLGVTASAMVVLDWARLAEEDLSQKVMVSAASLNFSGANPLGLRVGDALSVRDALYSTLLSIDDVSVDALAIHVGRKMLVHRQKQGDPRKEFMKEVKHLVSALGMRRTRFLYPHGGAKSYSTATDIALLSVYAMQDAGYAYFLKQKSRKVQVSRSSGARQSMVLKQQHGLLGQLGMTGVQIGGNPGAWYSAVYSERASLVSNSGEGKTSLRPRRLIVVSLASAGGRAELKKLTQDGRNAYDAWANQGYPSSTRRAEFLHLPSLNH